MPRPFPTRLRHLLLAAAAALVMPAGTALAADYSDPEWPCIQRKVVSLSPGMMWTGPLPDETTPDWQDDAEIAPLAEALAARRTPMEEAEARIADFAEGLGENRTERLTVLFSGVFEIIDRERREIISGIGRYAKRQTGLSEQLDAMRAELAELEAKAEPSFDEQDRIEELQDEVAWATRIYTERQQSLTYVCETPVILEKRAFSLARAIQRHLD